MTSVIGRSTVAWVGGSICVLILAAVSLFGAYVAEISERADREAFLKDVDALKRGVFLLGEFAAVEQVALAVRTAAYENISTRYDPVWVERNLGKGVFADPAEEEIMLVAASGEILHSSDKVHGRPHRVETLRAARLIAAKARRALDRAVVADTAGRIEMKLPLENALFDGVYAHTIALLGYTTAIVSAAVVLPDRAALSIRPEAPVVLVSVRPIREEMLAALGRTTQLGHIRFDRRQTDDPDLWGHQLAGLPDADRSVFTNDADIPTDQVFAAWPRKNVGEMVTQTMAPSLMLMASVLVIFISGAIVILRRMAGQMAQSGATAVQGLASVSVEAASQHEEPAPVDALRRKAEELRSVRSDAPRDLSKAAATA